MRREVQAVGDHGAAMLVADGVLPPKRLRETTHAASITGGIPPPPTATARPEELKTVPAACGPRNDFWVIRINTIPFIQSRASWPLILPSFVVVAGAWLTVSPLANTHGFVPLPPRCGLVLASMLRGDALRTQGVKPWCSRRVGE